PETLAHDAQINQNGGRNGGPDDLGRGIAVRVIGFRIVLPPVPDAEENQGCFCQDEEYPGNPKNDIVEVINLRTERGHRRAQQPAGQKFRKQRRLLFLTSKVSGDGAFYTKLSPGLNDLQEPG